MPYFPPNLLRNGAQAGATSQRQVLTLGVDAGQSRIIQSGSAQSTVYALSVQSSDNVTWVEILNSGGTGQGAFFGMSGNNFDQWNFQGGDTRFYTGTVPSSSTLKLTVSGTGHITAQGYSDITGTGNAFNGELRIGSSTTYQGRLSYEGAVGAKFYIENTYNSANGDIVVRTRTASTPVINATFKGSGFLGLTGITSPTAWLHTPASTVLGASLCIPHGVAPTSPVNGDIWTTTAGLFVRINGVTVGPLS